MRMVAQAATPGLLQDSPAAGALSSLRRSDSPTARSLSALSSPSRCQEGGSAYDDQEGSSLVDGDDDDDKQRKSSAGSSLSSVHEELQLFSDFARSAPSSPERPEHPGTAPDQAPQQHPLMPSDGGHGLPHIEGFTVQLEEPCPPPPELSSQPPGWGQPPAAASAVHSSPSAEHECLESDLAAAYRAETEPMQPHATPAVQLRPGGACSAAPGTASFPFTESVARGAALIATSFEQPTGVKPAAEKAAIMTTQPVQQGQAAPAAAAGLHADAHLAASCFDGVESGSMRQRGMRESEGGLRASVDKSALQKLRRRPLGHRPSPHPGTAPGAPTASAHAMCCHKTNAHPGQLLEEPFKPWMPPMRIRTHEQQRIRKRPKHEQQERRVPTAGSLQAAGIGRRPTIAGPVPPAAASPSSAGQLRRPRSQPASLVGRSTETLLQELDDLQSEVWGRIRCPCMPHLFGTSMRPQIGPCQ